MRQKRSTALELLKRIEETAAITDLSAHAATLDALASSREVSKVAEEAIALAREQGDPRTLAAAVWIAGRNYLARYQHARAEAFLSEAITRSGEVGDSLLQGRALESAAEMAFRLHDYSRTLSYAQQALEIWQRMGDLTREAMALSWIGAALMQMSSYQEAFERLYAAVELFKHVGKENLAGRALNHIAFLHEELGDIDQAFRLYERSLEMARFQGDRDMEGRVLTRMGEACVTRQQNSRALAYLSQAADAVRPLAAHSLYASCLIGIARAHMNVGENERAYSVFEEALARAERGEAKPTLAETLAGLGELSARMGDYEQARKHLYKALALAEEARVKREIYRINRVLSEVHEQFGAFELALKHQREFHTVRSSVYDELAKAKISSLTSQFELEKSRQVQEISHLRNVDLASAYDELKQLHMRLEQQARELREISIRDDLTGVYNRRYLDERLPQELSRARRYKSPLSVAMWDVDRFKDINDRLSHAVGDVVLKKLAEVVGERIRECDILARYGGEEFVIVFFETTLDQAAAAAEKIRAAVQHYDWSYLGPPIELTVSLGISADTSVKNWEELLANADAKLYEAKLRGRNRVCF